MNTLLSMTLLAVAGLVVAGDYVTAICSSIIFSFIWIERIWFLIEVVVERKRIEREKMMRRENFIHKYLMANDAYKIEEEEYKW